MKITGGLPYAGGTLVGKITLPNGSSGSGVTLGFVGDATTGVYYLGPGSIGISSNVRVDTSIGVGVNPSGTANTITGGADLLLQATGTGQVVLNSVGTGIIVAHRAVTLAAAVATTAGGAIAARIGGGADGAMQIVFGSGAPTASAPKGSLYLRTDGSSTTTRAYINTDAGTTWTAITTAA